MIKTKQTSKHDAVNDDIIYKMYASVLTDHKQEVIQMLHLTCHKMSTLYTLTSVCIFSSLSSLYFLMYWKENSFHNQEPFSWWSFPLFSWP